MREYYIRREGDEDASGPFDIDQISSLIEAQKLDASAYYYDIETESWLLISSNEELMETLFPKKRKLNLRTPAWEAEQKQKAEDEAAKKAAEAALKKMAEGEAEASDSDEPADDASEAIAEPTENASEPEPKTEEKPAKKKDEQEKREKLEVTRMLALAEGRADDPSGKSPREKQAAVAFYGLRFLTVFFIASVFAMLYIEKDLVISADAIKMAKSPFVIVAVFDLVVVITLLLQVTEVYPLLRFRAAIGAGLLSILYFSSGDTMLLLSNLLLMIAIYFCSAIIQIRSLILFGIAGLAGILGYLYAFFLA